MLASNGAPADTARALYAYNHADWYVQEVLGWAETYSAAAVASDAGAAAAQTAIAYGLAKLGTPYLWGRGGRRRLRLFGARPGPPTEPPGSACREPHRPSTTPARCSAQAPRSSRATSSSSAPGPSESTTSESS